MNTSNNEAPDDSRKFRTLALFIIITFVSLSTFQTGRKILQRTLWVLEKAVGGAPHRVTLPGPSGVPVLGNLIEVDFYDTPSFL